MNFQDICVKTTQNYCDFEEVLSGGITKAPGSNFPKLPSVGQRTFICGAIQETLSAAMKTNSSPWGETRLRESIFFIANDLLLKFR